jgi:NAD(P)-dependent dehydrogenase (short-subunit alcohol dehydrogenase family)
MPEQARRVVLVTGCSTGIGRATAVYLANRGWHVFATARRIDDIRELESEHLSILPLDVTDETARAQVIAEVVKKAGRLDGLVNNAGLNVGGPLELVSLVDAREQFETNVWSALRLAQLAAPVMRDQGRGRIVNISSVMARVPLPFSGLYNASKVALEALSNTLRWELSSWNIYISIVEPGSVQSNIDSKASTFRQRFANDPLYGRFLNGERRARNARKVKGPLSGIVELAKRVLASKPPLETARVIEHALDDAHPRPRYKAGLDTHIYIAMRSIMPDRLYDYAIERTYGFGPNAKKRIGENWGKG